MCPPTRIQVRPQGFTMTNEEWQAKLAELREKLSAPQTVLVLERKLHQEGHDGCFSSSYLVPSEQLTLLTGTIMSGHELRFDRLAGSDNLGVVGIGKSSEVNDSKMSIWLNTSDLAKVVGKDVVDMYLDPRSRPRWFTPDGRFPYDDPDFKEIVQAFENAKFPLLEIIIGEESIADWLSGVQDSMLVDVLEMFKTLSLPAPRSEKLERRLPFVLARLDRMLKASDKLIDEARVFLDRATKNLRERQMLDMANDTRERILKRVNLLRGLEA